MTKYVLTCFMKTGFICSVDFNSTIIVSSTSKSSRLVNPQKVRHGWDLRASVPLCELLPEPALHGGLGCGTVVLGGLALDGEAVRDRCGGKRLFNRADGAAEAAALVRG